MAISLSLSNHTNPAAQFRFKAFQPKGLEEYASVVEKRVWSPIIWREGKRAKKNFFSCEYITLDFDSGKTTLSEMISFVTDLNLAHIIGVTKSHQLEKIYDSGKVDPPRDRFRVVLRGESKLEDRELYEFNLHVFATWFGADDACKDAGRFFFPCKKIVSMNSGEKVRWLKTIDYSIVDDVKRLGLFDPGRNKRIRERYCRELLPEWIRDILSGRETIEPGSRHPTVFRIAAWLYVLDYSEEETVTLLSRTNLIDIGRKDLERTVSCGRKSAQNYD